MTMFLNPAALQFGGKQLQKSSNVASTPPGAKVNPNTTESFCPTPDKPIVLGMTVKIGRYNKTGTVMGFDAGFFTVKTPEGEKKIVAENLLKHNPQLLAPGTMVYYRPSTRTDWFREAIVKSYNPQKQNYTIFSPTYRNNFRPQDGDTKVVSRKRLMGDNLNIFRQETFLINNPELISKMRVLNLPGGRSGIVDSLDANGNLKMAICDPKNPLNRSGQFQVVSPKQLVGMNAKELLGTGPSKAKCEHQSKEYTMYLLNGEGNYPTISIAKGLKPYYFLGELHQKQLAMPENFNYPHFINIEQKAQPGAPNVAANASMRPGWEGRINFYYGSLHDEVNAYYHEQGHLLACALQGNGLSTPPQNYLEAINTDKRKVSTYGNTSPNEDFAEFVAIYVKALRAGGEEWKRLHKQYPHRAKVLDELLSQPKRKSVRD